MANSFQLFIFLAIAAVFVPSVLATDYMVGDDNGWNNNFNYTFWAQGKTFYVGDNLIFTYDKESHNVFKVNGTEFQQCKPLADEKPFDSGNDTIPLKKAERKWYICGKDGHCEAGQKLVITVMERAGSPGQSPLPSANPTPPPPPPPPSGGTKVAVSSHFGFLVVVFGILGMIMA